VILWCQAIKTSRSVPTTAFLRRVYSTCGGDRLFSCNLRDGIKKRRTGSVPDEHHGKTFNTCTIWLATAVILPFGVFRMNADFLFFMCVPAIIALCAFGATAVIWQSKERKPSRKAPGDTEV
jgi:hypothetical protein